MNLIINKNPSIVKFVTMPDGLQHVKVDTNLISNECTIYWRYHDGRDLMNLMMVKSVIDKMDLKLGDTKPTVNLVIVYNSAGRMDRRIDTGCPETLRILADSINSMNFDSVTEYEPHNFQYSSTVFSRYQERRFFMYFYEAYSRYADYCEDEYDQNPTVCFPDKGARQRYKIMFDGVPTILCEKVREQATGKLLGFSLLSDKSLVHGRNVLIVDDLCDGGGTFKGISQVLRENGAIGVGLAVVHGVFSKGLPIDGIDWISSTDTID